MDTQQFITVTPLTDGQIKRAEQAMAETQMLLAREQGYSLHLQKPDYIASLTAHIAKLAKMLETKEHEVITYA